jgi:ribulose-phosphate 3-epimerase
MTKIAPSLLSADFARLAEEVREMERLGADWLHVDVMDGHFVPNITIGPLVVKAIRQHTSLPLDVHLMITDPDRYVDDFAKAGADIITVHAEATVHLHRTLQKIKQTGTKAGVALNPATPLYELEHVLSEIDLFLLMSVNPGFGGQRFIPNVLPKIERLNEWLKASGLEAEIEVDGGINAENAALVKNAGATVLVAGSFIFGAEDRQRAVQLLKD